MYQYLLMKFIHSMYVLLLVKLFFLYLILVWSGQDWYYLPKSRFPFFLFFITGSGKQFAENSYLIFHRFVSLKKCLSIHLKSTSLLNFCATTNIMIDKFLCVLLVNLDFLFWHSFRWNNTQRQVIHVECSHQYTSVFYIF